MKWKNVTLIAYMLFSLNNVLNAQTYSVSGIVTYQSENNVQPLPFATVKVYNVIGDSLKFVKGRATDSSGNWEIKGLSSGLYQIEASYVGMRKQLNKVMLNQNERDINFILHDEEKTLDVVEVRSKRQNRYLDKTVYTFSNEDVAKSMDARDLLAHIPNLFVNTTKRQLETLNGKSMMVLIDGVPSDDVDLRLVSPDKVKNVEYYDVPPIKYVSSAQIVVNVHLKPIDRGWNFSSDVTGGKMFCKLTPAFSFIRNRHKFTVSAGAFINPKFKASNTGNGIYEYKLGADNYRYQYDASISDWSSQNDLKFKYLNAKENDYTFSLNASVDYNDVREEADKDILFSVNGITENTQGYLHDKVYTWKPTVNAYFNKCIDKHNSVTLDMVGTYYGNTQQSVSSENGSHAFYDNMMLKNKKYSFIGEALYEYNQDTYHFSIGYKFSRAYMRNSTTNSLSSNSREDINTTQHHYYAQWKQSFGPFSYELSLAGTSNIRKGLKYNLNNTFTPRAMIGYRFNDDHYLRLKYSSYTIVPDIMQTSQTRILVMNNIYKTGNPNLQIANIHTVDLTYSFNKKAFDMEANFFFHNNKHQLYDGYYDQGTYLEKKTVNYDKNIKTGMDLSVNYRLGKYAELGVNFTPTCQVFRPDGYDTDYSQWSFPVTIYASANYKAWSLSYYQKLGNYYLNGIYREGIEKVSYISLDYKYKYLWFTLSCYFPFIKDKFTSSIVDGMLLKHSTSNNITRNNQAIQFSVYLSLHSGKQKRENKNINNKDTDNGVFNLK